MLRQHRPTSTDSLASVMSVLDAVFKAYDIRGTTPDQLDADLVRTRSASAFARFVRTRPIPTTGCSSPRHASPPASSS
jgi:hypothetical protein